MPNERMTNCRAAILAALRCSDPFLKEEAGGQNGRPTNSSFGFRRSFVICHWALVVSFISLCLLATSARAADWQLALPGWGYTFPRDHGAHPEFKTEWWYFTGNLREEKSWREFG